MKSKIKKDKLMREYFYSINDELHKAYNGSFSLDGHKVITFPLFLSAIEHSQSIYILKHSGITSSVYALARPALESYLRAMWAKYCLENNEFKDDFSSIHFPRKLEYMLEEIDEKVDSFTDSGFLQSLFKEIIPNIHDFTHGGVQSINRLYSNKFERSNLNKVDDINLIMYLAVIVSGLSYVEILSDKVTEIPLESIKIRKLFEKLIRLSRV